METTYDMFVHQLFSTYFHDSRDNLRKQLIVIREQLNFILSFVIEKTYT